MRRGVRFVLVVVLAAAASLVVVVSALAQRGSPATGIPHVGSCRYVGDPIGGGPGATRIWAQGEFWCSKASRFHFSVCAAVLAPGSVQPSRLPRLWCQDSVVDASGNQAHVTTRTKTHACGAGLRYVSVARIDGGAWSRGPWRRCGR
jgi:hypothetical protein